MSLQKCVIMTRLQFYLEVYQVIIFINTVKIKFKRMIKHSTNTSRVQSHLSQKIIESSPQNNTQYNDSQNEEETVQMVIQFGPNKSASLLVNKNDDPLTLAKKFCFKHNIDPRIILTLANNIKSLQHNSFKKQEQSYKYQRNQYRQQDKQNINKSNWQNRSNQRQTSTKKISKSRSKTNQSNINDSTVSYNNQSSSRYSVFDRLYQDSKRKSKKIENQKNNLSTSNIKNKSLNQSSIQNCVQIYQKNKKLKQQNQKYFNYLHQLKQQEEIKKCKFQPQINPLSKIIALKLRQNQEEQKPKQNCQLRDYLQQKQQKQLKQCTFKPKIITKISQNYVDSVPRFQILYQKSNKNHKKIQQQLSHQPKINQISKKMINKPFYMRLKQDQIKRQQKKQSKQRQIRNKSHQRRPSTGRAPINRNLGDKSVGQYLFQKSKNQIKVPQVQQNKIVAAQRSSQMYNKSKKIAVDYIFQLLDSDEDGLISSTKINIINLSDEILRLLAPLLAQMQEVDVQLNKQQFNLAFERLYSTFNISQKNTILKVYKTNISRNSLQPSFKPNLNEQSLRIAKQSRINYDLYTNGIQKIKQRQERLIRIRAQKMLQQFQQCTFHPKIYP